MVGEPRNRSRPRLVVVYDLAQHDLRAEALVFEQVRQALDEALVVGATMEVEDLDDHSGAWLGNGTHRAKTYQGARRRLGSRMVGSPTDAWTHRANSERRTRSASTSTPILSGQATRVGGLPLVAVEHVLDDVEGRVAHNRVVCEAVHPGRWRVLGARAHRAYMITPTPTRQMPAPTRSAVSGWKPSKATPHSSEPTMNTPP